MTPPTTGPDAGDILWIDFGPPFGHEQAGRRPALVLSPKQYNDASSYVVVCPITRNARAWPFKVILPKVDRLEGFILVDQVRSIDRHLRAFRVGGRVPEDCLKQVYERLGALLGLEIAARSGT